MKINIECEIPDEYVDSFLSMLHMMEILGSNGSSKPVAMFVDGDGDFRPKFKFNVDYKKAEPITWDKVSGNLNDVGFMENACMDLILYT